MRQWLTALTKQHKALSVTGAFLLMVPSGIQWYWGNLCVYVLSYCQSKLPLPANNGSTWVISLLILFRAVFFIISGHCIHFIGKRTTVIVGIVVLNTGVFGSYLALQHSITLLNVMQGAVCGVGLGLVYGVSMQWGIQWSDERDVGLITSLIQSGSALGGIVMNQFVTMYLNPQNLKPEYTYNGLKFFSSLKLVNQVPVIFCILGACFVFVQLTGSLLIRERSKEEVLDVERKHVTSNRPNPPKLTNKADDASRILNSDDVNDLTPRQMFRSCTFYLMFFTFTLSDYPLLIVLNYYKTYGQLWISDDHFLTCLGTTMAIVNVPSRVISGLLLDKIGVKATLILNYSVMTVACAFLYVAPMINRWLYFLVIVMLAAITGSVANAYAVATVKFFGRKHSLFNIGWLNFLCLASVVISPVVMNRMVANGLWAHLFFSGAGVSILILITVALFLPQTH